MSRGKQRFTKAEIQRAIKAAQDMDLTVSGYRIEVANDKAAIVVSLYGPDMDISKDSGVSSWDSIIRDLERQTNDEADPALCPTDS